MLIDEIKKYNAYVIYGAQVVAVGTREAVKYLTGKEPKCFAVGNSSGNSTYPMGNPESIDGIKVVPIEDVLKDTFIVVAVTELIQKEVLPFLESQGYKNVFPMTQHEEFLLMSEYYKQIGKFPVIDNAATATDGTQDLAIYEVKNDRDKALDFHPELFSYEKTIQAGAALADVSIADIHDDTGINISKKNRMYCEMSAVYWIWKNTDHDWIGIEHYRRHLLVKPEMLKCDIDVIMPLPRICYPHEMAQFLRFTTEDVMNALFKALEALHPEEYENYKSILFGKYQYTYDMVCARRYVFDNYCRWFFEITEYMEREFGSSVPELLNTRALSYVAEVLTNLYFMSHQKDLRIRHVEMAIYT